MRVNRIKENMEEDDNPRPLKRGPGGQWISSNGTPLEALFQENYLMLIMSIKATPEFGMSDLAQLEKSGSTMRQWIQQFRMWETIFQRDYPEQFQESVDLTHPSHMNYITRRNLDEYSEKPGRNETYWKRLYELNVRGKRQAKQYGRDISNSHIFGLDLTINLEGLPYTMGKIMGAFPANKQEKDDQGNQVLLYQWRGPSPLGGGEGMHFVPPVMVRVVYRHQQEDIVSQTMDFTPALLGEYAPTLKAITVPLLKDGALQFMNYYPWHGRLIFSRPTKNTPKLVSHCISSNCTNAATSKCGNCQTASYCSVKCQASDWSRHKKECNH